MGMYSDIRDGISETVRIMGYPFYAEDITSDESYNRRDYVRQPLLNGTEDVRFGKYIPRKFSFVSDIYFKTNKPQEHDEIFQKMMSNPVTVTSKYMGGSFKAEVVIQKHYESASPNHMKISVDIIEVPTATSNIPGEKQLKVPKPKTIKITQKGGTTTGKTTTALTTSLGKLTGKFTTTQLSTKAINEALKKLGK